MIGCLLLDDALVGREGDGASVGLKRPSMRAIDESWSWSSGSAGLGAAGLVEPCPPVTVPSQSSIAV